MLAPWQGGGAAPAYETRTVDAASVADLQRAVDAATGPTVLLVRAPKPLLGGSTLTVSKPDIVITTAAAFDPTKRLEGPQVQVACGGATPLVAIK
jgi:hypothetical protein